MRFVSLVVTVSLSLVPLAASGQQRAADQGETRAEVVDPTGGAYTSPTTLFTPAAALPTASVRLTTGLDVQSPSGGFDVVRPLVAAEVGLGRGFTVAAGTRWFGGDTASSVLDGLTPYGQVRLQLFGAASGLGFQGGAAVTYKAVGFGGTDHELEASFSLQYRRPRWELGVQGVLGQSLTEGGEHDLEVRFFGGVRPIPELAVGLTAQLRGDVGEEEEGAARPAGKSEFDALGGAMVSLTLGRWQVGGLAGASTLGLYERAGFLGQAFGTVRF